MLQKRTRKRKESGLAIMPMSKNVLAGLESAPRPRGVRPPSRRPTTGETIEERRARYAAGRARGPEIAKKYGFPVGKKPPKGWVRPTGPPPAGRGPKKRKVK